MSRLTPFRVLIAAMMLGQAVPIASGDPDNPVARAALDVFAAKCTQCHGPQAKFPKAGFGFVTDLARLVASDKYIVPGKPERSELWKEIDEGDMPPDTARAGPLTPAEADAVRRWILAGAPTLAATPTESAEGDHASPGLTAAPAARSTDAHSTAPPASETPPASRWVTLVGRLHVVVVHFPIALLVVAAFAEVWDGVRHSDSMRSTSRVCLTLGAASATAAAVLGWVHALEGFDGPLSNPASITGLHRWIGTAVGIVAPAVAFQVGRDHRRGRRTPATRISIILLAAAVAAAAHFGGLLTHGAGYLDP